MRGSSIVVLQKATATALRAGDAAQSTVTYWEPFLTGAVSGSTTALLLQPFDVIKTRQQLEGTVAKRAIPAARDILRGEGPRGFLRGAWPTILRVTPGAGVYFCLLEQLLAFQRARDVDSPISRGFASGTSRLAAVILTNPLLVVKTRVESEAGFKTKQAGRTCRVIKSTLRGEGISGFYKGLLPTIIKDAPFAAIYYTLYTSILELSGFARPLQVIESKRGAPGNRSNKGDVGSSSELQPVRPLTTFLAATSAGVIASLLTHPFDVIRTRLQIRGYKPSCGSLVPQQLKNPSSLVNSITPGTIAAVSRLPVTGATTELINAYAAVPTITVNTESIKPALHETVRKPQTLIERRPEDIGDSVKRVSTARQAYSMYRHEGLNVFWRGLLPRLLRRTLATALAWTAFEELNQRFVGAFTFNLRQGTIVIERQE